MYPQFDLENKENHPHLILECPQIEKLNLLLRIYRMQFSFLLLVCLHNRQTVCLLLKGFWQPTPLVLQALLLKLFHCDLG